MTVKYSDFNQKIDASWGLIYRINGLWQKIDPLAATGRFDEWNAYLDRIFCNLLYRDHLEEVRNAEGELVDIQLNEKDKKLWHMLNSKVVIAKKLVAIAKTKTEFAKAKEKLYRSLMLKDIGLRKFMNQLKLYMKESDSNPSRSMWGG